MSESSSRPSWREGLPPAASRVLGSAARRLRRGRVAPPDAARASSNTTRNGPADDPARGLVEEFSRKHISGWVAGAADDPPAKVTLHVNDLQIAATWAGPSGRASDDDITGSTTYIPRNRPEHGSEVRTFHFALKDVWNYCAAGDRLRVRLDGVALPIAGRRKRFVRPARNGRYGRAELESRFEQGWVFNQQGRLQLSKKLDTEWQAVVISLYDRVSAVVSREFGYDAFLAYGSLLGQVREGGFIGHDVDFDAAYVSALSDPELVARELRDVALRLVDAGFSVICMRSALHVSDVADPGTRIDLFHLYFDDAGELQFPFGTVSSTPFTRSQWSGVVDADLGGHPVRVPGNAAAVVEHIYGPLWQVPVPGFNWRKERTTWQPAAWTRIEYREEVYWANFYARHEIAGASSFFDFVSSRDDVPTAVLDIGCGDGRDSFAFARGGCRVLGIDRSQVGVRAASAAASAAGLADRLSFDTVDVADAPAVRASLSALRSDSGDGAVLFYLRFFLHSIPEDVQTTLLDALAGSSRDGDMVAIEFRTDADAEAPKVHGGHYRRYQSGPAFGRALRERFGFADVRFEQESAGLAPYRDEDPVVYRVIAAHGGASGR